VVIVVIGNPIGRLSDMSGGLAGVPAQVAAAAARAGAAVQLVGKAGEDPAGNALMLALARAGIGHVALLRDPAHSTPVLASADSDADPSDEPVGVALEGTAVGSSSVTPADPAERPQLEAADIELALRYLPDYTTLVVAEPVPEAALAVVADAASWVGATLMIVVASASEGGAIPASATVFEAPSADPDGSFATMLGELAAAVDRGTPIEAAFREVEGRLGVTPAAG
jgi:sugar/nucleoside kinase (ribokinase family)